MNKKPSYALLFILIAVLAAATTATIIFTRPYTFHGTVISPPFPVSDFALETANEESFRLSDVEGKFVLLFFGYTSCPDVCPTTLATLKLANEQLGESAKNFAVIMVTADPERDTPERVSEYVARFNPSFIGLSGDPAKLAEVWDELGIFVEKQDSASAAGYLVSHTSSIFVLNPNRELLMTFPFGATVENIVSDLTELLRQSQQT